MVAGNGPGGFWIEKQESVKKGRLKQAITAAESRQPPEAFPPPKPARPRGLEPETSDRASNVATDDGGGQKLSYESVEIEKHNKVWVATGSRCCCR